MVARRKAKKASSSTSFFEPAHSIRKVWYPNGMTSIILLLSTLLGLYSYILVGRIVIEMIQAYSRQFRPPHWFVMIAEFLFTLTDPPVKALRKVIPPLRLGGIALDVSIIVLFILISLLRQLLYTLALGIM